MLTSIYIENIALIKRLSLEPSAGFCAFTGETGAGKSIIIDSLGLLCGARSDKDIIRTGEDQALVEGIFEIDQATAKALEEFDIFPEDDGTVTITRKITRDGKSGAKINGRNVPLSRLKASMSLLLSIHGQQDTQAFAESSKQREMLDAFANNQDILSIYKEKFDKYKAIKNRLDDLETDSKDREYRLDMLKYRINELSAAKIQKGEKAELEILRKRLANSEKIISNASNAYFSLYSGDGSASETVNKALSSVNSISNIIPQGEELLSRLENIKYEIIDIADSIKEFTENDGENVDAKLDQCESRLELIKKLENKYRADSEDFPALLEEWEQELNINENSEEEKAKLLKSLKSVKKDLEASAEELHSARIKASKTLCKQMTEELGELDMPNVTFEINVTATEEFESHGTDHIEFLISPNKGEIAKPMSKIASGGELSRIMLCLKCVFAHCEAIGTLIFDEIDAGVSGKTSEKIGIRLKKAADGGKTQVICVTHSAILAAKADVHYKISKKEEDQRTVTKVELLDKNGRRDEIARILGGLNITETVIKAAEEMLCNE